MASPVTAQPAKFRQLGKLDGLSQSTVFGITQDANGLLWFGTRDGLNEYNGYEFRVFRQQDATPTRLVDNDTRCTYYDPQSGHLWIGTLSGLSRFDPVTRQFHNYPYLGDGSEYGARTVRVVFRDAEQRLWIGTGEGLLRYDPASDCFERVAKPTIRGNVNDIFQDRAGHLWIGGNGGLYRLETATTYAPTATPVLTAAAGRDSLSHHAVHAIREDRQGNLWLGTGRGGLNRWDRRSGRVDHFRHRSDDPHSLSSDNVRAVAIDPEGNLWVGTARGLNRYDPIRQGFHRYLPDGDRREGLSDASIHEIFFDRRGAMWVGTYHGGVNYFDRSLNQFHNVRPRSGYNSLNHGVVSSFQEDELGNLYIGTEGGGLNYRTRATGRFTGLRHDPDNPNSPAGNNIKTLLYHDGRLWLGTFARGLDVLDTRTGQFHHYPLGTGGGRGLSNPNVYGLHLENDRLWIATFGGGLNILDLPTGKFHYYPTLANYPTEGSDHLRVVTRDQRDRIWLGTSNGLTLVHRAGAGTLPTSFTTYFPQFEIYCITPDAEDNLWLGTVNHGLVHFDPLTLRYRVYGEAEGLPGHHVFGILRDRHGKLWISTNNGLAQFDPAAETFIRYDHTDGLENTEFNFNAYFRRANGELLFGGLRGYTAFDPDRIIPNTYVPPVVFTDLLRANRPVRVGDESNLLTRSLNATEELEFAHNRASFTLKFAALDYHSPANNRYAYRLEGLDEDWTYARGETQVTYQIQRPGTYRFRLRGANSAGVWNPEERQLTIRVTPPPWASGAAYVLYALLLTAILYGSYRFLRIRHRLRLERIAGEQQEQLHRAKLRFFTNVAHEFRTPLTLITGPLEEVLASSRLTGSTLRRLQSVNHNAQRLLALVNQLLTFRKLESELEALRVAEGNIVGFTREVYVSFLEHARIREIDYQFHADREKIDLWYDRDKLEKVLFNLLSNAFKFTPDGGRIAVRLVGEEEKVRIEVSDTGPGIAPELHEEIFRRFYEKAGAAGTVEGSGIGLAISRQMAELHGGRLTVVDEPGPGATLQLSLPTGRAHFRKEDLIDDFTNSENLRSYEALPPAEPAPVAAGADAAGLPQLLIVEDNPEVRDYIERSFAGHYRIVTAENGKRGLELATELLPDVVISDVMMPEMDGFSMCQQLKQQTTTSHIPVLLLTARTATVFRIEGLETGADDYITKPFSPQELRLRVRNVLLARQRLREKFARLHHLEPREVSITSADEQFLELAIQTVELHIDRPDFTVDQFAHELSVSRALLFTKLKALTDLTPNNFVKSIRLKRAAQLLALNKLNISEVAYRVGFRDPRYFSKCFRQQYDRLPSDYVEDLKSRAN